MSIILGKTTKDDDLILVPASANYLFDVNDPMDTKVLHIAEASKAPVVVGTFGSIYRKQDLTITASATLYYGPTVKKLLDANLVHHEVGCFPTNDWLLPELLRHEGPINMNVLDVVFEDAPELYAEDHLNEWLNVARSIDAAKWLLSKGAIPACGVEFPCPQTWYKLDDTYYAIVNFITEYLGFNQLCHCDCECGCDCE